MTVTTYRQWRADGSPWHDAAPIGSFATTIRGHGYTVYTIGAVSTHLDIAVPEDHAPFSHTPWPGPQPYSAVLACDIMPGGVVDLAVLGAQIYADKQAGHPGLAWLKYMNWTDAAGNCWHDTWMPHHARRPSTDRGHIHLSARTDYVNTSTSYDPIEEIPVALTDSDKAWLLTQIRAPFVDSDPSGLVESPAGHEVLSQQVPDGTVAGSPQAATYVVLQHLGQAIKRVEDKVDALAAKTQPPAKA